MFSGGDGVTCLPGRVASGVLRDVRRASRLRIRHGSVWGDRIVSRGWTARGHRPRPPPFFEGSFFGLLQTAWSSWGRGDQDRKTGGPVVGRRRPRPIRPRTLFVWPGNACEECSIRAEMRLAGLLGDCRRPGSAGTGEDRPANRDQNRRDQAIIDQSFAVACQPRQQRGKLVQ